MVRCQRRRIAMDVIDALPERLVQATVRCTLLLRLAVLLHRGHDPDALPEIRLAVDAKKTTVRMPESWLSSHPLTRADLGSEREEQAEIGCTFDIRTGG
jgi:exopolyphosphatase/guanosine-5'-triphosphate,3'-diphosphate pyrophosphatase